MSIKILKLRYKIFHKYCVNKQKKKKANFKFYMYFSQTLVFSRKLDFQNKNI